MKYFWLFVALLVGIEIGHNFPIVQEVSAKPLTFGEKQREIHTLMQTNPYAKRAWKQFYCKKEK